MHNCIVHRKWNSALVARTRSRTKKASQEQKEKNKAQSKISWKGDRDGSHDSTSSERSVQTQSSKRGKREEKPPWYKKRGKRKKGNSSERPTETERLLTQLRKRCHSFLQGRGNFEALEKSVNEMQRVIDQKEEACAGVYKVHRSPVKSWGIK